MDFASVVEIAKAFGPPGLIIGYLLWQQERTDKRWLAHEEKRLKSDDARTACDKDMVQAVTALRVQIEAGQRHVR